MTIEQVQRYWDSRPCNVRHSEIDIDENPLQYSRNVSERKFKVEPHLIDFADFGNWYGMKVLDLGCGVGTQAIQFAMCGVSVTAVDLSKKSLEIARKRIDAYKLDLDIQFTQANIEELPAYLPHSYYDLIFSFGVIHHTPNPERVIRHVKNYLAPDGEFRLMLYHRYSTKAIGTVLRYWRPGMTFDDAVAKQSEAQSGCPITRTYTKQSARELLKDFDIVDMRVEHIFPYKVKDYIKYKYIYKWYWRILPRRVFRWLEQRFGWHLLITARLK